MKGFFLEPECREVDGLKVLVLQDNSFPVVSILSFVRTGSVDEKDSIAGISHFVEHLLFKGTPKRPTGSMGHDVMRMGGEINGFTTYDYTGYTVDIEGSQLDLALDIHGDAMADSSFDPEEIEKERTVIMEEVNLGETSPELLLGKNILRRAFPDHPYGRPIIGYMDTVGNVPADGLLGYYKRHYCRENMTVVVAGDVNLDSVLEKTQKRFSGVAHGEHSPAPVEAVFGEGCSFTDKRDVNDAYVKIVMPGVSLDHPDYAAISVLSVILGAGQCGRLSLKVKYPGIANSIGFGAMAFGNSGILSLSATCQPPRADELVDTIMREFNELTKQPPSNEELDRARRMVISSSVYDRDTFSERAAYQAHYAALAYPQFDREYLEAIDRVSPEQLLSAAQTYLNTESAIIGKIMPEKPLKTIGGPRNEPPACVWTVSRPELTVKGSNSWETDGKVKKTVLKNGITFLYQENRQLPIVACRVFSHAGSSFENASLSGLASMTQRLLLKGAAGRSFHETSYLLESLGIEMFGSTTLDNAHLHAESLSDELDTTLVLLRDAVASPNFDGGEMERIRRDMIARVRHEQDDMGSYIARAGAKALWSGHPYERSPSGEENDLLKLTLDDVRGFHKRFYRPNRIVVSMVGDTDSASVMAKVESVFGELTGNGTTEDNLPQYTPLDNPLVFDEKKEWPAAIVAVSWRCPSILDNDFIPLRLLSAVLGNPFHSRIWNTIREERGLAYTTGASYSPGMLGGTFSLYAGVNAGKISIAKDLLLKALEEVRTSPVTEKELNDSKTFLTGSYRLHHQSAVQMADYLGLYETCGLGYAFDEEYVGRISAVSIEDLIRVVQNHLHEENFLTLTVTN